MSSKKILGLLIPALTLPVMAAEPERAPMPSPFQVALNLENEGQDDAAFLHFAAIAGAEMRAVILARPKAAHFLELLRADKNLPELSRRLIEGDLLLALQRRAEALSSYRAAAQLLAEAAQADQRAGWLPRRAYAVEPPPPQNSNENYGFQPDLSAPLEPFTQGAGNHRDNWLLRRFIALEAWDEAAQELSRVWEIHRARAKPYYVDRLVVEADGKTRKDKSYKITPSGFDGWGLQFAVDYAYFLKRRQQTEKALAVLREPFMLLDREREGVSGSSLLADVENTLPRRVVNPSRSWGQPQGISRQEFLRLAYGEFQNAKRAAELKNAVQEQIKQDDNRARRVLAAILLHENQPDAALHEELKFINRADFDAFTKSYRRGLIYEEFHKTREAINAYEAALKVPRATNSALPRLPDAAEETRALPTAAVLMPISAVQYDARILAALERLYSALGDNEKVLDTALRQVDGTKEFREGTLDNAVRRFAVAGQEERFTNWARQRLKTEKNAASRAEIAWTIDDIPTTITAIAELSKEASSGDYALARWKERFKKRAAPEHLALLQAITKANPQDAVSRLELLEIEGQTDGPALVEVWQQLIDSAPETSYIQRGPRLNLPFKNYFQLAYRLARHYEKSGQTEKLQALALRVACGEKPFGKTEQSFGSFNDKPEYANALLALAIQKADDVPTQNALAEALEKSPWQGALAQLNRRRNLPQIKIAPPIGWANAPQGVQILASQKNVLSLCRDEQHLYAGQPWGVAIYDFKGEPVTRVALGEAALDVKVLNGALWVATPVGVERVDLKTFAVSHLRGDQDVEQRISRDSPDFYNGAVSLATQGDFLWIGTRRDIRRLNTRTEELRLFSQQELQVKSHTTWQRFLFDGPFVWADGDKGFRRFDTRTERWQAPDEIEKREPTHIIDIMDGKLWGTTYLNEELRHRPCLIDRETLQITPISLEESARQKLINQPFTFHGRYRGQPVFVADGGAFAVDAATHKMRALNEETLKNIESELPEVARSHRDSPRYSVQLPDGTWAFGKGAGNTRYQYPREDWPFSEYPPDIQNDAGGLFFISSQGQTHPIANAPRADVLPGDTVFTATSDGKNLWLGTSGGIAELDGQFKVVETFSHDDGLPANRISGSAAAKGQLYFATRWNDAKGALLVYHLQTRVFTALLSEDGLASDALENIKTDAARPHVLTLDYGVQYRRWGEYNYQKLPSGWFDAATEQFSAPAAPRILNQTEAHKALPTRTEIMPILGGYILERQTIGQRTILCGTRGVLIFENQQTPILPLTTLAARVIFDPRVNQLADAKKRATDITSVAQLKTALQDENLLYRAASIARAFDEKIVKDPISATLIAAQLNSAEVNLRGTAFYWLTHSKNSLSDAEMIPLLQNRLTDAEPSLRYGAIAELSRRGKVPNIELVRAAWKRGMTSDNVPYGADSNIGIGTDFWSLQAAVAPHATAEIFALLLEYPMNYSLDVEPWPKILQDFGASLRRHPEAAPVLLRAYDKDKSAPWQVRIAQLIFKGAGTEMLPVLRAALKSPDRIARSNAARAVGAIGDASLVPALIAALDLESGLSRASIVWALGELKAPSALPLLASLYADAQRDAARGAGAGFLASQAAAVYDSQTQFLIANSQATQNSAYATLKNVDAIGGEWDELKASSMPRLIDPKRNEDLLKPEHILEAVAKIGAQHAQEFYRALAGSTDARARAEAAAHLADATPNEVKDNLPKLRALLGDTDLTVRRAAAVSLISAGQNDGQTLILAELRDKAPFTMLQMLQRIENGQQLAFARQELMQLVKANSENDYPQQQIHKLAQQLLKRIGPQAKP